MHPITNNLYAKSLLHSHIYIDLNLSFIHFLQKNNCKMPYFHAQTSAFFVKAVVFFLIK